MLNKKISKLIFFILLLFLFLGANFVSALEINYPDLPGADPPQNFVNDPSIASEDILSLYVKYFFNLSIWIAGIIALGALIYGGVRYLTSTGKPDAMASAKDQITAVFFGLLLLLSSYIVLSILNPELIVLKIPKLELIEVVSLTKCTTDANCPAGQICKPEGICAIPPAPTKEYRSTINVEIPFGTIIEKGIFGGTIPWEEEKRIPRIYNNSVITKTLADNLKQQSENLYNYSYECTCRETEPVTPCGENRLGDTTWKCDCGGCEETEPVTSDPCNNVRGDIQDAEQKNLENIYLGTEITYTNKSGDDIKITTSLAAEQAKTEEEVRLLKEQLDRLERAEKFMLECYDWIDSLSDFLIKKTDFSKNEWPFRKINLWEEISIKGDWATFYCPVSGTILGEGEYAASAISPETIKELEEAGTAGTTEPTEPTACTTGIPVGEIIDKTKRVGYKVVERMEELIELDKKLIDAVDELQVLVSQCSSQRGCERRCLCWLASYCFPQCMYKKRGKWRCGGACQGWVFSCADSSLVFPGPCLDRDEDTPCPYEEIDAQIEKIREIHQRITEVIEGKKKNGEEIPEEKIENIGILLIIDEVIPKILEDLEIMIREGMKTCISEIPSDVSDSKEAFENSILLSTCESALNGVGPEGIIIQNCCLEQEEFQGCLGLCYLQEGEKKYKDCLQECLEEKAEELESAGFEEEAEILKTCRHKLNFYCCGG